jgi:hypothetical protein
MSCTWTIVGEEVCIISPYASVIVVTANNNSSCRSPVALPLLPGLAIHYEYYNFCPELP